MLYFGTFCRISSAPQPLQPGVAPPHCKEGCKDFYSYEYVTTDITQTVQLKDDNLCFIEGKDSVVEVEFTGKPCPNKDSKHVQWFKAETKDNEGKTKVLKSLTGLQELTCEFDWTNRLHESNIQPYAGECGKSPTAVKELRTKMDVTQTVQMAEEYFCAEEGKNNGFVNVVWTGYVCKSLPNENAVDGEDFTKIQWYKAKAVDKSGVTKKKNGKDCAWDWSSDINKPDYKQTLSYRIAGSCGKLPELDDDHCEKGQDNFCGFYHSALHVLRQRTDEVRIKVRGDKDKYNHLLGKICAADKNTDLEYRAYPCKTTTNDDGKPKLQWFGARALQENGASVDLHCLFDWTQHLENGDNEKLEYTGTCGSNPDFFSGYSPETHLVDIVTTKNFIGKGKDWIWTFEKYWCDGSLAMKDPTIDIEARAYPCDDNQKKQYYSFEPSDKRFLDCRTYDFENPLGMNGKTANEDYEKTKKGIVRLSFIKFSKFFFCRNFCIIMMFFPYKKNILHTTLPRYLW